MAETTASLQQITLSSSGVEHRRQQQPRHSHHPAYLHALLQPPSQMMSRTPQRQTALPTRVPPLLLPASSRRSLSSRQLRVRRFHHRRTSLQLLENASSLLRKSPTRKRRRLACPTDLRRSRSRQNRSTLTRARLRPIESGRLQLGALHSMHTTLHLATMGPAHLCQALDTICTTSMST